MVVSTQLVAKGLTKRFGQRVVVNDVSIKFQTGRVTGLLGPNGAGKTTTFYMIVGLLKPDTGSVVLGGQDITSMPLFERARNGIGYLPQEASIFQKLTVWDNLMAVLEMTDRSRAEMRSRADELLADFRIESIKNSRGYMLSGGERRRVEIARALALDPKFVLLDEPFAGIDPLAVQDIQQIINQLKSRGLGILITDHNVRETLHICDEGYILSEGTLLEHGTPEHIAQSPKARSTYLGENFTL